MTLHSASLCYPENPSAQDQHIAALFITAFTQSISCHRCYTHFREMHERYVKNHPDYLKSRQSFAIFVFRAHNTVNKRIDKPVLSTVEDCLKSLKAATANTSFKQFRDSYLKYLTANWNRELSGDAIISQNAVKTLKQINIEYLAGLDTGIIPELLEEDVVTPVERIPPNPFIRPDGKPVRVGFKGGKLRLG